MTDDEIIDAIIDAEGEGTPPYIVNGDKGGRTRWGISERAHPAAWRNGPPSRDTAVIIYRTEYVKPWSFVEYEPLKRQLIDCNVVHGRRLTTTWIQCLLAPWNEIVDGVLGERTRTTIRIVTLNPLSRHLLNNALVALRLKFIDDMTDTQKSQKPFEEGWESRALRFVL